MMVLSLGYFFAASAKACVYIESPADIVPPVNKFGYTFTYSLPRALFTLDKVDVDAGCANIALSKSLTRAAVSI